MKLFKCCCDWSFVVGKKQVYGPIYAAGLGEFPALLASSQRMMTRAEFEDSYADCAACHDGFHRHSRPAKEHKYRHRPHRYKEAEGGS